MRPSQTSVAAHDLEKQFFQRLPLRRELVDVGALRDEIAQDLRQYVRVSHAERQAVAVDGNGRRPRRKSLGDVGRKLPSAHRYRGLAIEQCLKLARLQNLTMLNEGHPVAGALDLAQQVRVEQHGGAPLALGL